MGCRGKFVEGSVSQRFFVILTGIVLPRRYGATKTVGLRYPHVATSVARRLKDEFPIRMASGQSV